MTTKTSTLIAIGAVALPLFGATAFGNTFVGYVTEQNEAGLNLYGINLLKTAAYQGDASIAGSTATISGLDLDLANNDYFLLVTDGANEGENALVTAESGDDFTLDMALASSGTVSVAVHPLFKFGEVFGGLGGSSIDLPVGSTVLVPSAGGFVTFTASSFFGSKFWNAPGLGAADPLEFGIYPGLGILINQPEGSDPVEITIAGSVLQSDFKIDVTAGNNLVANVYPTPTVDNGTISTETLDNSGLTESLVPGEDSVLLPVASGFATYNLSTFFGSVFWAEQGGSGDGSAALPLDGGYLIVNGGALKTVTLTPSF